MAAAPCHHSKDQPAPTHRGRDRLRRRRQRPSQVRSKTSRARPCEASGALLLSNGGSGGGHETCTLWTPPAAFGYFPMMESTSPARRRAKPPTRNRFLMGGRERVPLAFSCFMESFASAEATKGLSDRPLETFGVHLLKRMGTTRNGFLVGGKGKSFTFFFLFLKRFRLSGGDQGAFRSPPGPLRGPLRQLGIYRT